MSDMPAHEVAVTVFATVHGVDARDAANRLERAVMNRMLWGGNGFYIPATDVPGGQPAVVHTVTEAGAAISNGYLRSTVTAKARRESPHPQPKGELNAGATGAQDAGSQERRQDPLDGRRKDHP